VTTATKRDRTSERTAIAGGTIDHINTSSTSGFISTEDVKKDVLFMGNMNDLDLEVGLEVEFEVGQTTDGPRARKLRRA
jgi:cold shock CspA family protein